MSQGRGDNGARTFSTGIGLHKLILRTCFGELWGKPCELWEDFVHKPDLGGKRVAMDVES